MINVFINKAFFNRNHNEISLEFQPTKTERERDRQKERECCMRTGFWSQFAVSNWAANEAY